MKKYILSLRQRLLRKIIPSFFWPKTLNIYGVDIKLRNSGYSTGTKWALITKNYEKEELYFVNKHIREGDFVIELGASIGIVTRLLSFIVGSTGKVIAVEASKQVFSKEMNKIMLCKNVSYLNAIGFPCNNLNLSAYENINFEESSTNLGGRVDYTVKSYEQNAIVDLSLIEEGYKRYCLVVDIEGAEREILLSNTIIDERVELIIIELHPAIYGAQLSIEVQEKLVNQSFKLLENKSDVYVYCRS